MAGRFTVLHDGFKQIIWPGIQILTRLVGIVIAVSGMACLAAILGPPILLALLAFAVYDTMSKPRRRRRQIRELRHLNAAYYCAGRIISADEALARIALGHGWILVDWVRGRNPREEWDGAKLFWIDDEQTYREYAAAFKWDEQSWPMWPQVPIDLVQDWRRRYATIPTDRVMLVDDVVHISPVWDRMVNTERFIDLRDSKEMVTCTACGYDLRGLDGRRCPECGITPPSRRGEPLFLNR